MNWSFRNLLVVLLLVFSQVVLAQCPQLLDGNGNASATPRWVHCNGTAYTLYIQTNQATGPYTINWGDGSPVTSGASLIPPATVSHTYAAGLANYTLTFTEPGRGCTITGLVVLERPVNAAINRPLGSGGVTTICAPGDLGFINSSTDVSQNTTFRWNFGDGSPILTKNYTDSGQTNTHTYQRNTVNCNTVVRLEAENYCTVTPSFATVGPINIYDLDDAAITASATFLCYPDTEVTVLNTSNLNCRPQGNTTQRYEYWNFGRHWGNPTDSINGWIPFANPPSVAQPLAFPGKGSYTITMYDSNMCGIDTTTTTIVVGDPPVAAFSNDRDTICAGNTIRFFNNSTGGANQSRWNFGDGVWRTRGMGNQTRRFNSPGTYTIQLAVYNTGGTNSCRDTVSKSIHVLPGPTSDFNINPASGCDSILVNITENSGNAAKWSWNFGDGTTDTVANPPAHLYNSTGSYTLSLLVTHSNGCTDNSTKQVDVFASPIVNFTPKNVCEGVTASFTDNTTSPGGDPLTSWSWDFGNGNTSTTQNPTQRYDSSGNYSIVLTVTTANCSGTDTFPVVVEPKPTAQFSISDTAGCSPLLSSFTNSSLVSTLYHWDFGDGDTSNATTPTHTFRNNTGSNVNYTIRLIAKTAFGCSDTAFDSVEVYQVPNSSFTSNALPKCGPNKVDFTNTSTGGISNFWIFGDGDTTSQPNPTHTYQNKTLFIQNYTAQLVVGSPNGCTDTSQQIIVVYPEPQFTFQALPDSGCSPLHVTFPAVTGAVGYKWYFGDGDSATGSTPVHTYLNSTTNNVSFTVTLIATSSFGCSDTNAGSVLVHPNPAALFSVSDSVGCQPNDITINNLSTGAMKYHWDFGNGDTSDTSASVFPYTYLHNSTITQNSLLRLIATTQDGCKDTASKNIRTYPKIKASFLDSDSSGCSPLRVNFTNLSSGQQFNSWNFGDGITSTLNSPTHTFTNSRLNDTLFTVQLKVTSQFGCSDSISDSIRVHPLPIASFTKSAVSGCHPFNLSLTNTSSLADTNFWAFGDGSTLNTNLTTVSHTYLNTSNTSLNRSIRLIVETNNGCRDTASQLVDVYPYIKANFIESDSIGCSVLPVSFRNLSVGAQNNSWNFGDGITSTLQSPQHGFSNNLQKDTVYRVKLVVSNQYGCSDSISDSIRVHPLPVASFTKSAVSGCHPFNLSLTNTSSLADTNFWTFGDGGVLNTKLTTISHTYLNTGTTSLNRNIRLIVESVNGCRDTTIQTVDVYPLIEAGFNLSDSLGCTDLNVKFQDQSRGAQFYAWQFGDGFSSTNANPNHTYRNILLKDTNYRVTQIVRSSFGCSDTLSDSILVYPKPVSSFTTSSISGCQPLPVNFTNNSVLNAKNYWNYGDGDTSMATGNPTHTYSHGVNIPQKFSIQLIVESNRGCRDTSSKQVEVFPKIVANFNRSDSAGCSAFTVNFTNQSTGENQYNWTFGDGNSERIRDPQNTFVNNDTINQSFTTKLKVLSIYGCADSIEKQIVVYPQPVARFTPRPITQKFPNATVSFNNLSSNGPWSYNWDFGDTSTSVVRNPNDHDYNTWGNYPIKLVVSTQHCSDTAEETITIEPPAAQVSFNAKASGCRPLELRIENNTIYGKSFLWNFGDGGTSNLPNPPPYTYYNSGTYTVSLTVVGYDNGVVNQFKVDSIKVYDNTIAHFDYRPIKVSVPNQPVLFYNLSQYADRWTWNFGDGNSSNEKNPEYYFQEPGIYTVQLISDNEFGCKDTFELENAVEAISVGSLEYPTAFTPNLGGSSGGYYNPQSIDNDIFFPIQEGVVEYELFVFNRWGEMVFTTTDIKQGWDGYYRGSENICPQDVYVWKAVGKYANGKRFEKAGEVTLLQ